MTKNKFIIPTMIHMLNENEIFESQSVQLKVKKDKEYS